MIQFPSQWMTQFGVNLVTATPPEAGVSFRYYERLAPQPSFSSIVRRLLDEDPDFIVHNVGEMHRTVSNEGEYGAWLALTGTRQSAQAFRYIGAIFLDEFAAALDCTVDDPLVASRFEVRSRSLLNSAMFRITQRPRRFYYQAPSGWQAIPSSAATTWYPPDFPNNRTTIVVPLTTVSNTIPRDVEVIIERISEGLHLEHQEREVIESLAQDNGTIVRVHGTRENNRIFRQRAVFSIKSRIYRFELETTIEDRLDEHTNIFNLLVQSFRPLPSAEEEQVNRAFFSPSGVFEHWVN